MEHNRKNKMVVVFALVLAIASLTIGFAAFSTTLSISSGATVTPNSSNFNVVFSSSPYVVNTNDSTGTLVSGIGTNGAQGGIADLYLHYASGLTAQFTKPGQSLSTTIYAHNIGQYDAYLTGVSIGSVDSGSYKKCIGKTGTSPSLVQAACNGISIMVGVSGSYYNLGEPISGHALGKGDLETVEIIIFYDVYAQVADGEFDIEFGDIILEYSTVDNADTSLSSFRVFHDDEYHKTYNFVSGMTWREWISSEYNNDNSWLLDSSVCFGEESLGLLVDVDWFIQGDDLYLWTNEICPH